MSRKGKSILFASGVLVYVIGLALLTLVNSRADNWAGAVSPLLILGGLATIFVSLLLRADDDSCDGDESGQEAPDGDEQPKSAASES